MMATKLLILAVLFLWATLEQQLNNNATNAQSVPAAAAAAAAPEPHQPSQKGAPTGEKSQGHWGACKISDQRDAPKLPHYFNFSAFGKRFKKGYTRAEVYLRRSIFIKKCLEVFRARVNYRRGSSTYLSTINKFSDRSRDEFNGLYMLAPPFESLAGPDSRLDLNDYMSQVRERQLKRAGAAPKGVELESQSTRLGLQADEHDDHHDHHDHDDHHDHHDHDHDECSIERDHLRRARNSIQSLLRASLLMSPRDPTLAMAIEDELNEAAIEVASQTAACPNQRGATCTRSTLPWPGWASSSSSSSSLDYKTQLDNQTVEWSQFDWSQHECFHQIYDQGTDCGKCYVMATSAVAEFYKCTERGPQQAANKRQFSKDYVLNCGPKFSPTIMGCAGGSVLDTLSFMAQAGVFNIRGWRQRRQEALRALKKSNRAALTASNIVNVKEYLKCPLDPLETPLEQWGPIRVHLRPLLLMINTTTILEALHDGPLVVSVQMPPNGVDSYAEGVHQGDGCATSGLWHAMILVGYGRDEQGKLSYWRFRNSFGHDWGMGGHFHLSAEVPVACFGGAVRVIRNGDGGGAAAEDDRDD